MKAKTLLYLASGEIYNDYHKLPFDLMIFVDRLNQSLNILNRNHKFINADAFFAIESLLKKT